MKFGYARVVSTDDQDTTAQLDALGGAGCARVFEEHASGDRSECPELHRMMEKIRQCRCKVALRGFRCSAF